MSSFTRKLHLSASPLLAGFHTLIHAGALVSLLYSSIAPLALVLMALVVLLSAYINLRDQALRCTSSAIVALRLDEYGHCRLWQRDQVCIEGLRLTGGCNASLALCLSLRDAFGKTYHLNIARDAVPGDDLRSLRMRFEHALVHGNAPQI